jgi:hypothetical protein
LHENSAFFCQRPAHNDAGCRSFARKREPRPLKADSRRFAGWNRFRGNDLRTGRDPTPNHSCTRGELDLTSAALPFQASRPSR